MSDERQQKIREDAETAREAIQFARGEVEVAVARLRAVQMRCTHPNTRRVSHMGETATRCTDCGHED